jgi:hypothetical protein
MENNTQQSKFILILKQVWPYIYRVINSVFYFVVNIIRYFFKNAIKMIKGEY